MLPSGTVHVTPGQTKAPSPPAIKALGEAKNSILRTYFGGGILLLLCVAYSVALKWRPDQATAILPVIGTGLGFMLGRARSGKG